MNDMEPQADSRRLRPIAEGDAERPVMQVRVRDHATEAANWGRGRGGPVIVTVNIPTTCPTCGGPRGEVRGKNGCDDGEYYHVNVWSNPCGHVDYYDDVITEAARFASTQENSGLTTSGTN